MKANKIGIYVSVSLNIILGNIIFWVGMPKSIYDILIGIFTGLVVSLVTSVIGYYIAKDKIRSCIEISIPDTYVNMKIIHSMTGGILPQVIYSKSLDDLNYKNIIPIVDIALKGIKKEELNMYDGIVKHGKLYTSVCQMINYDSQVYNLKSCINNIIMNALEYDKLQLERKVTIQAGGIFPPEMEKLIFDTKNCVNIQTAKVYEYEASLINIIDEMAEEYFGKKSWEKRKEMLLRQVDSILNDVK